MQDILKSPRNGCGLHGAVQTIAEIQGVVPIVHSNAGCVLQNALSNQSSSLGQGCISGEATPSTVVQERHIIFGGASRLREQIKNTIKVVKGEVYLVLNSCESAMVGDDIEAMTREAREQGESVIECLTAGFHGDSHYGYQAVVTDLLKKIPLVRQVAQERDDRLVNIFGVLPQKDVYFRGSLEVIKRVLQDLGLKVNTFFGVQDGLEEFVNAKNASLNLVFSKWGKEPAEYLEHQYDIPTLVFPSLPTGPAALEDFVKKVADVLSLDEEAVGGYVDSSRAQFDYYFRGMREEYYKEIVGKTIALAGDESTIIQIGTFLKEYLGAVIETAVVTDYFGEENQKEKPEVLQKLAKEVYFTQDGKEIQDILIHSDIELILGSSLEDTAAKKNGIFNLEISYPIYGKAVINKTYAGIQGALSLTEDYITAIRKSNQFRDEQLLSFIEGGKIG